jgi:hypothetical protein
MRQSSPRRGSGAAMLTLRVDTVAPEGGPRRFYDVQVSADVQFPEAYARWKALEQEQQRPEGDRRSATAKVQVLGA